MEQKIEITCPVSVGDKLYRTDKNCSIIRETVTKIEVYTGSYTEPYGVHTVHPLGEKVNITISTSLNNTYSPSEIGDTIFLDKKELIQKLVNQL